MDTTYEIYTDGGSRGNPGPAAIGFVIYNGNNKIIYKFYKKIGETTNNVAEYTAVIEALLWIKINLNNPDRKIFLNFYSDSELLVNQINGKYKIRDEKLFSLINQIKATFSQINAQCFFQSIPREKNSYADCLVNQSLDEK